MITPVQQQAVITEKAQLTPHVYRITFHVEKPLNFAPGQYVTVIIDAHTRRQYSFFSPSTDPLKFDIVVDVTPMGPGSKFFLEKNVGDAVGILGPLGLFQMTDSLVKKVFVATGTGVAPFYSMISTYLSGGGTADIALYWGLRFEEDIFCKEQWDALQNQYRNFRYSVILSKPTAAWQGNSGHVNAFVDAEERSEPTTDFYLCGNRNMLGEVQTSLLAQKATSDHIKMEPF